MLARVATTAEIVMSFLSDSNPLLLLPNSVAASPLGNAFDFERFLSLELLTDSTVFVLHTCKLRDLDMGVPCIE